MHRILIPACLALALLASATRTHAHHAFAAEFDAEKKVTLVGTVVQMEWTNPHAWLTIDVPDEKGGGQADRWSLEFGPPNQLFRRGWRKTSLMPGMKVTATGFLAKDGRKVANADQITLPDGKRFGAQVGSGGAQTDPESAPKQ
jgi:hypothetical protein